MALEDLLKLSQGGQLAPKIGMSEERVLAQLQPIRDAVSFWREYPDYFVDFMKGNNPENFNLFFYQRVFLRAVMRHRYAYATYPRA